MATGPGEHLDLLVERINQLGGKPDLTPEGVSSRAATEYVEGENPVDMIKENLIAERLIELDHRHEVCAQRPALRELGRQQRGRNVRR